jgi:anti-sigma regulatory factor (Ser/Thr protein kinase)
MKVFERNLKELDRVFQYLSDVTIACRLSEANALPITVAIEELFSNAVRHNPQTGGDITIAMDREANTVTVVFQDSLAPAYDITRVPETDVSQPLERRQPGRLGVHLIRRLMDSVDYAYVNGSNLITMTKHVRTDHV